MAKKENMLKAKEVSEKYNIPTRTLYDWKRKNKVKFQVTRGRVFFEAESVEELLRTYRPCPRKSKGNGTGQKKFDFYKKDLESEIKKLKSEKETLFQRCQMLLGEAQKHKTEKGNLLMRVAELFAVVRMLRGEKADKKTGRGTKRRSFFPACNKAKHSSHSLSYLYGNRRGVCFPKRVQ